MTKSSSLTSIPTSEPDKVLVDQSDIITLTQDVKCFSDGLNRLKTVFEDHGMIQYCSLLYYLISSAKMKRLRNKGTHSLIFAMSVLFEVP